MKREKGITLIALVITIIVLLILAGISIATLTGENGLVTKANTAKTETKKVNAEEQVKIAVTGSFNDEGKLTADKVKEELRKIPNVGEIRDTNGEFPIEVDLDGYTLVIDGNGKVTKKAPKPVINYTLSTEEQVEEGTEVTITITATIEEGETITKITKPDGTTVMNTNTTSFPVTSNGIYTVTAEGSGGGTETCKIKITNIGSTEIFSDIYTETETYTDKNGNVAKIPKGFAVGESNTINTINGGLVITDSIDENYRSTGNQFVWIPVGTVYKDINKTKSETVELDRYTFATNGTRTKQGTKLVENYYQESTTTDISKFKTSAATNKGYYIGRYEIGKTMSQDTSVGDTTIVCKEGREVYVAVQPTAVTLTKGMYPGNKDITSVTSNLMNSYAWDTAIVYIQMFSGDTDYSRQPKNGKEFLKTGKTIIGGNKDVRCNIFDMAENYAEHTTESSSYTPSAGNQPYTIRAGGSGSAINYVAGRSSGKVSSGAAFRPILYLN